MSPADRVGCGPPQLCQLAPRTSSFHFSFSRTPFAPSPVYALAENEGAADAEAKLAAHQREHGAAIAKAAAAKAEGVRQAAADAAGPATTTITAAPGAAAPAAAAPGAGPPPAPIIPPQPMDGMAGGNGGPADPSAPLPGEGSSPGTARRRAGAAAGWDPKGGMARSWKAAFRGMFVR